ncbi:uncharacterized protein LOC135706910 [Ochlerotatus camptorhynchus]|uniref:uncharacterized protein LOC135706910 n=1 Tax=Ochlerotatus camptorhynchus TaxID=644619 RepID=UPI0031D2D42E
MCQIVTLLVLSIAAALVPSIRGHGMLLDPIARGSRWRCNSGAPANYDDNGLYCGGYFVQWEQNGGKCGFCGDNYADARPRMHEIGGPFGQGEIVRNYSKGAVIEVKAMITANHMGHLEFNVCDLSRSSAGETEECYQQYKLSDVKGRREWYLNSTAATQYTVMLQLPADLVCEHCVLQWTYVAGNNWGWCGDGTGKMGCGPQEHFRTCSDIGIYEVNDVRLARSYEYCNASPRSLDWIFDNIPEEENLIDTD